MNGRWSNHIATSPCVVYFVLNRCKYTAGVSLTYADKLFCSMYMLQNGNEGPAKLFCGSFF